MTKPASVCVMLLGALAQACAPDTAASPGATIAASTPAAGSGGAPTSVGQGQAGAPAVGARAVTPPVVPPTVTTPPAMQAPMVTPGQSVPPAQPGMEAGPMTEAMMEPTPGEMAMTPAGPTDGTQPMIPEVSGECPEFRDGSTIQVAGHRGILILAGAPGMGGPLLFYWHGTGGSAGEAQRTLPAKVISDIKSSGGIVASFNGSQSSGTGRDCSGTGAHNMADFEAADQIVACAVKNHGIDPKRIYSTGCSAGGLQTGCMAAQRSNYIAAVTPNSGGVVGGARFQGTNAPAAMTMHGGSGDNVIVNFGETSNTFGTAVKGAGGFWVDCNHMSGHCGARGAIQEAAWEFLKAHPYGTKPSPYAGGLPSGFPNSCMIK